MTWFGSYEVLYELRSGGMGNVLLARRRGPGGFEKLVAIKTIRTDLAGSSQLRAMFLDEAAILARLSHPAVATVHDFGEIDDKLYLVMEYVAGVSLHHLVGGGTPPVIAARIVAEACRGIHAAHELRDLSGQLLGVVHRDISPDNVLIDFCGHVKVIDFGIALSKGRQAAVTEMGMLKGKPPYMSPEQLKNEAVDRRSDVFSLAVVLWELIAGRPLFGGDSLYAIARAVEDQPIAAPSTIVGPLPPGLDAVVMRGLARDPQWRFTTAAEMADQLGGIVAAESGEPLESYCARILADQRESHRQWLANILGGAQLSTVGRPTGAITAVAKQPTEPAAVLRMAPVRPSSPGPTPAPMVAREDVGERAGGRRPLIVAATAVVVAAVAAIGWQVIGGRTRAQGNSDAAVAALGRQVVAPGPWQLEEPAAALIDAGVDAPPSPSPEVAETRPVSRHRDRDHATADARSHSRRRDPAAAMALVVETRDSAPVGIGFLKVTAHPFAYVSIDDGSAVSTPILKARLPAGAHQVVLTDPSSGARLLERTVTIVANQLTTVSLP